VNSFYVRRFFRILPAAFFYLLVIAILAGIARHSSLPGGIGSRPSFFFPQLRHVV